MEGLEEGLLLGDFGDVRAAPPPAVMREDVDADLLGLGAEAVEKQ
jgi:hypothetical protein